MVQVFDFAQNMAGVVRLSGLRCTAGTNITLRHAELLMHPPYGNYDGSTIYVGNLRGAKATDVYTCRGDPAGESYVPTFTQHGFRCTRRAVSNAATDDSLSSRSAPPSADGLR